MQSYLWLLPFIACVNCVPFDLLKKEYLDYNYLEVGFIDLDPFAQTWVSVKTTTNLTGEPIVFISIPDVAAILNAPWYTGDSTLGIPPIVPKLRDQPTRNADGTYSFEFNLRTVNDSFCNSEWWVPIEVPAGVASLTVSWLVARRGVYSLVTNYTDETFNTNVVIDYGNITRASAAPQATNDNGNAIQFEYPTGCVDPSLVCTVMAAEDIPGFSRDPGSIQQLQTSNNEVDGQSMFLSVRAWQVKKRSIWLVLVPHDSVDPAYFEITTPEIIGFMVFPVGQRVVCTEGFAFETMTFNNVTHIPIPLDFRFTYDYAPGVFGMLGSVFSMVDSTTLSVYDRTATSAIFVTKEDQCVSEQVIHTTPEIVHVLIFGEVTNSDVVPQNCSASFTPPNQCLTVEVSP
mmetsp:Transcript_14675/g.32003  ORF Transcript_14675/g.32003 Transcript_14675/m.32003 type:complete len:401 (+) Transcript_14675:22-1224(+)